MRWPVATIFLLVFATPWSARADDDLATILSRRLRIWSEVRGSDIPLILAGIDEKDPAISVAKTLSAMVVDPGRPLRLRLSAADLLLRIEPFQAELAAALERSAKNFEEKPRERMYLAALAARVDPFGTGRDAQSLNRFLNHAERLVRAGPLLEADREALFPIFAALASPDRRQSDSALSVLARTPGLLPGAATTAQDLARSSDPARRSTAARLIELLLGDSRAFDQAPLDALASLLRDRDEKVRLESRRSLALAGSGFRVPHARALGLPELLPGNPRGPAIGFEKRSAAAQAILALPAGKRLTALREADVYPSFRFSVLFSLVRDGPPATHPEAERELSRYLLDTNARLRGEPLPTIAWRSLLSVAPDLCREIFSTAEGVALVLHTLSIGQPDANDRLIAELAGGSFKPAFQAGLRALEVRPEFLPETSRHLAPLAGFARVEFLGERAPELLDALFWTAERSPHLRYRERALAHILSGYPEVIQSDSARVLRALFSIPNTSAYAASEREILARTLEPEAYLPRLEKVAIDPRQPLEIRRKTSEMMASLTLRSRVCRLAAAQR